MAGLNLKNIYKVYPNGTKAVNDFSLDIQDKEFIVFVGPSGCGKSTVLRMIAGLEEISAGELKIDDIVVNDVECKLRDTAMVFQNYALYPHMTVADNMAFPIKMTKPTKAQKAELYRLVDEKYPPHAKLDKAELAEIKKRYKADKKVVLTQENKAEISEILKNNYPRSLKNFLLKPFHYLYVRHDYISAIREERNLKRPPSLCYNILRPLHYLRIKREDMYGRVVRIAEILGLEDYLSVKPGAMSGGQRQRVALGRAMVRNPKVFLLDEPLSNLDAKLRNQMRSEITKLHNRLQTTFIYVTHDQVEAMTMGDRIVVMKKGRIQQTDTPLNLYTYPENLFVAGFIGTPSMNFFDATVDVNGDTARIAFANDRTMEFSAEHLKKFERKYLGKPVTLGVRPEDFVISDSGVECVVLNTEMLGSETLLYCDFDTQNVTNYENGKHPFIVKTNGVCLHKSGDIIKVAVKFDKAHYFDKASEESVMKRFVAYNEIPVAVKDGKIDIGGKKAQLPPELNGLAGQLTAVFPSNAVYEGGELKAKVLECEQLKQGWLTRLAVGNQKLYAVFEQEVSGEISIGLRWHTVTFTEGDVVVKEALNTENKFDIKLEKRKLTSEQKKALAADEKRRFDVDVHCGDAALVCPTSVLKRLLGASDRKLFGVDLQLIFDENAITDGKQFKAQVKRIYDYGNQKYALCSCLGVDIVLPIDGETEVKEFGIDLHTAAIYDDKNGIKIT